MESNLTKKLNEAIKNAPQSYPIWGMRTWGSPSILHWSLVEGYFYRHYIVSTFTLSSPWAKYAPVARGFPTLTLIQWGGEGGPYLSTHAVPSFCRLTEDSTRIHVLTGWHPETILGRERAQKGDPFTPKRYRHTSGILQVQFQTNKSSHMIFFFSFQCI